MSKLVSRAEAERRARKIVARHLRADGDLEQLGRLTAAERRLQTEIADAIVKANDEGRLP